MQSLSHLPLTGLQQSSTPCMHRARGLDPTVAMKSRMEHGYAFAHRDRKKKIENEWLKEGREVPRVLTTHSVGTQHWIFLVHKRKRFSHVLGGREDF